MVNLKNRPGNHKIFLFEHRGQPLLPRNVFLRRLIVTAILSIVILTGWVILGIFGYHWLAGLGWIDSFLNAAMIVGGMGPVDAMRTSAAKIFAGFYAILSGALFLSVFGLLAAPIIHRFLHKFHLEIDEKEKDKGA